MPTSDPASDPTSDSTDATDTADRDTAAAHPGPVTDTDWGAFTTDGPWDLHAIPPNWLHAVDRHRAAAAATSSQMRSRRLPPPTRVAAAGAVLGSKVARWAVRDRGTTNSVSGLSRRLRDGFVDLGATYIKLGQILSAGEGIFPADLVAEMRMLRDQVPAEPFRTVQTTLEEEFGRPFTDVFSSFDAVPLAAASIAQVHAATLRDGHDTPVVVKVQRPGIAKRVAADVAAMTYAAPKLVGRIPIAALANPPALVDVFADTIAEELDFRVEAANMLDVARALAPGSRAIVVPRPHPELVSRRVLVMERFDGFAFDDVDGAVAAGVDPHNVVQAALIAFLEGLLLHGIFHGDLHGGNLLIRPDGTVGLLDFGICGRLTDRERQGFMRLMSSVTDPDPYKQLGALIDLGALPDDCDIEALINDLDLAAPVVKDPTKMAPEQLVDELGTIVSTLLASGARLPKSFVLFVKDMVFFDGAMATWTPDVDLFDQIGKIGMHFAFRHTREIAAAIGKDESEVTGEIDAANLRRTFGIDGTDESFTWSQMRKRREQINARLAGQRSQLRDQVRARSRHS